jgi:hypothetical protein
VTAIDVYSPLELCFYLGGFLLWGVAYGLLVVRIPRQRFVEIPFFAVCGNTARSRFRCPRCVAASIRSWSVRSRAGSRSTGPFASKATTCRSARTPRTS